MRRVIGVLLAVLCACGSVTRSRGRWRPGPGDDLPRPERTIDVLRPEEEVRAANGFRLVVVVDPMSRLVELGLRVRTGHVDDPPGKEGLAHLVEHLVFELRPGGPTTPSLGARLQAVATGVNATTELEATHFTASAPRDVAARAAEILAEIPQHATCANIDRRVFEREREVVRNELHLRSSRTSRTLLDALTIAAYPAGHPYRRVSHTSASLDAITWADVCQFLEKHYRPSEMFVVLGGGVLTTELAPLQTPFDPIVAGAPAARDHVLEGVAVRERLAIDAEVDEDLVMLVWPMPGRYSADGISAHTIAAWLGGALAGARREGRLGDNRVLMLGGPRAPYMVVVVERGDDSVETIRSVVAGAAARLWDEIDADNAYMVRQGAVRAVFADLVAESGRTSVIADYTQYDAGESLSSDVDRLVGMRRDDLEALTREMVTADRASIIEVNATDPLADRDPPLRNTFAEPPASVAVPDALGEGLFQSKMDLRTFTLDNGLHVVLAPARFAPLVHARLVVPGGTADHDNPAVPLYAGNVLSPPRDGAGSYGAAGILLVTPLADYDVSVSAFWTTFEVSALGGWQDYVVWGLARMVEAGRYEKDDVARVIARARAALPAAGDREVARQRAVVQAWQELRFGKEHPVSRVPFVTAKHLDAVDTRALTAWHDRHHRPEGATLVVTGHFSPGLMEKHIREAFARWKGGARRDVPGAAPAAKVRRIAVVDADETHVTFELHVPAPLADARAEAAALVAAELLDERVRAARDKLGAAYAIHARAERGLAPGVLVAGQVDGALATEVFALVARALADVRGGAFTDDDLQRARRRASRTLRARLAIADPEHVRWRVRGKDLEYGSALVAAIDGIGGEAGRKAVAAAVARHEQVMLVGPAPALTAAAKALGGAIDRTIE